MAATSISDIISGHIADARSHLNTLGTFLESHDQALSAINKAFLLCDGIEDLITRKESIKQLTELMKDCIKAGLDISSYLSYYIGWIKKAAPENAEYIGYATEVSTALSVDIKQKMDLYGLVAEELDRASSEFRKQIIEFTSQLNDREKNKHKKIHEERREMNELFDGLLEDISVSVFTIADIIKDIHKALHDKNLERAQQYLKDAQEKLVSADKITKDQYAHVIHDLFLQLGIATKCALMEQHIDVAKKAIKGNVPEAEKHIAEAAVHLEAIKHSISSDINKKYQKELEDLSLQLQNPTLIVNKALEIVNHALKENNLPLAQKKIEMASAILEQMSPDIRCCYDSAIEDMNLYIKTLVMIEEVKDFLSNPNNCSRVNLNKKISTLKEIETACERIPNKTHREDCMVKLDQLYFHLEEKRKLIIESYINTAKAAIKTAQEAKAENKNLSGEILKLTTLLSELEDIHIIRLNLTSYDDKQQLMDRLLTLSETLTSSKKALESRQPKQQGSGENANSLIAFFSRLSSHDARSSRTDSNSGKGRDSITDRSNTKLNEGPK